MPNVQKNKMEEHLQVEKVIHSPCPSCGGKLLFSAEYQQLSCNYCGYKEDINRENDQVEEQSLHQAVLSAKMFTPEDVGEKVVDCMNCGAKYMLQVSDVDLECPFCGSTKVNLEAYDHNLIQPLGILPFQIPKKEALNKFQDWIKKGWFYPSKLKQLGSLEKIHGVYIPFWTFDAETQSTWRGEAGHYYYETQRVYIDGRWQSKQVQKVRWTRRNGQLSHFFDDVLVVASKGLGNPKFKRILTYRLDEVINFDPRLILGWEAEIYSIEVDSGYDLADRIMDNRIRGMCISRLGGDTYRNLHVDTNKADQTFKLIILPVWICAYQYNNKTYQFVINGQSGRIDGEKPYSWIKIAFAVLLAIAVIAGVVFIINV